jgi:hypothetical protein
MNAYQRLGNTYVSIHTEITILSEDCSEIYRDYLWNIEDDTGIMEFPSVNILYHVT